MTIILTHAELTAATGAPAWIDEAELPLLAHCAAQVPDAGHILEVGAAFGGSATLFLLFSAPQVRVTSVDAFVTDPDAGWRASALSCGQAVRHGLDAYGKSNRILYWHLMDMPSQLAVADWTEPLDALYIDGDHSVEGVNGDFEAWTPVLVSGGTLMLHDSRRLPDVPMSQYARGWPAPTALADRLRTDAGWRLLDEGFSLTVWEKV